MLDNPLGVFELCTEKVFMRFGMKVYVQKIGSVVNTALCFCFHNSKLQKGLTHCSLLGLHGRPSGEHAKANQEPFQLVSMYHGEPSNGIDVLLDKRLLLQRELLCRLNVYIL